MNVYWEEAGHIYHEGRYWGNLLKIEEPNEVGGRNVTQYIIELNDDLTVKSGAQPILHSDFFTQN